MKKIGEPTEQSVIDTIQCLQTEMVCLEEQIDKIITKSGVSQRNEKRKVKSN